MRRSDRLQRKKERKQQRERKSVYQCGHLTVPTTRETIAKYYREFKFYREGFTGGVII